MIERYSVIVDEMKLGSIYTSFIIIYMKSANHHESFIRFLNEQNAVTEAHRVSGEGCYHLKVKFKSQEEMNVFLDEILFYGNYMMHLSINEIKNNDAYEFE